MAETPSNPSISKEDLERIRKKKNRLVMSEFIRIGSSDLYDWQPVRRAILKEIAFMHSDGTNTKRPTGSPFKDYEGWCYASQLSLAIRVGTSEGYVQKAVAKMEKDGVIVTREWTDIMGRPHQEYHVVEEMVTAHQHSKDYKKECKENGRKEPRRGGNTKANRGSFQKGNKVRATQPCSRSESHPTSQPYEAEATRHGSRSHPTPQPLATRHHSRKPPDTAAVKPPDTTAVSHTAAVSVKPVSFPLASCGSDSEGCFEGVCNFQASGQASVAASAATRETGSGMTRTQSKTNQNLQGFVDPLVKDPIGHGQRLVVREPNRPVPNKYCYPDLFKNWQPGMKVPKCKRCDGLLPPDENHVCEGYVPKYPDMDYEARDDAREDAAEFMEEERLSMR
jgi:hypothetical protein